MQGIFFKYQQPYFFFTAIIIFLFYVSPTSNLWASTEILIDSDKQFLYAEQCFSEEEYLDAATEYKRFIYFFPDDARNELARFNTGLSLYRAGRYQETIRFLRKFVENSGDTGFTRKASFLIAGSFLAMGQKGEAIIALHNLVMLTDDLATKDFANYELGWIWLERPSYLLSLSENEKYALEYFEKVSLGGQNDLKIEELLIDLKQYHSFPRKNTILAGSLSVVPGAGQLYCERYQDSITAFLLNVALGIAAFESFDHENYALGGLISVVGSGFYIGNIYGAVSSAHKYNKNSRQDFIENVKDRMKIDVFTKLDKKMVGLTFQYAF